MSKASHSLGSKIRHAGRLGIYQILFEWISEGKNVYTIGDGSNIFQFIHRYDLMSLYMLALDSNKPGTYNVGTTEFGSLKGDLKALIDYAGSDSKVKALPKGLTINTLKLLRALKISPLAPYHYMTYHTSCYFDPQPCLDLGWKPKYSNMAMWEESYDWYLEHGKEAIWEKGSAHRAPLAQKVLKLVKLFS